MVWLPARQPTTEHFSYVAAATCTTCTAAPAAALSHALAVAASWPMSPRPGFFVATAPVAGAPGHVPLAIIASPRWVVGGFCRKVKLLRALVPMPHHSSSRSGSRTMTWWRPLMRSSGDGDSRCCSPNLHATIGGPVTCSGYQSNISLELWTMKASLCPREVGPTTTTLLLLPR